MAFLFGVACGSVGKTFGKSTDKKDGVTCVMPMQSSSALTIMENIFDATLPEETRLHHCINSAGSAVLTDTHRDMTPPIMTHGTSNPDSDIGVIPEPINSS